MGAQTVRVFVAPFVDSDLRQYLMQEVADQRIDHLPSLLFAGTGTERRLATVADPSPDFVGRIERTWFDDAEIRWTGGWGTHLLTREGRPFLAVCARVRWRDDQVFAAVWARLPGTPVAVEDAETWEGTLDALPRWLLPLFPALGESAKQTSSSSFRASRASPTRVKRTARWRGEAIVGTGPPLGWFIQPPRR